MYDMSFDMFEWNTMCSDQMQLGNRGQLARIFKQYNSTSGIIKFKNTVI
jgi:hypothetical protein